MSEAKAVWPSAPAILPIWLAIPRITEEIQPIAKSKTNPQQNYKFRGIDDVYAGLNLLLAKYHITILAEVLESHHDAFNTAKGSQMFRHRVRIRYTLLAGDGSTVKTDCEGEGMDSGDKATPKAWSTAYKTMAFELFCIPTGEKIDTENESPEVANERDPDELFEEFRQALLAAKDIPSIRKAAAAIKSAHDTKKITDLHRAELLKVYGQRSNDLVPKGNGEAKA